jgi:peptidoglycan LD-endopeptidase CwlK
MPDSVDNPFRAEIDAALAASTRQIRRARTLTGDERIAALNEAERLNDLGRELLQLGLKWAELRLVEVVQRVEQMVQEEEARQSDVLGTIRVLLDRLAERVGRGAARFHEGAPLHTPAPTPVATLRPVELAPHVIAASLAGNATIDVHGRDTDLEKLHPSVRERVSKVVADLDAENIPLRVFEAYRAPERQVFLFAKGRDDSGQIVDRRQVVTFARPWHSYHQYGLAVDMVIHRDGRWSWDDSTPEKRAWWSRYHDIARNHGLEPLSFEKPHVQLAGTKTSSLRAGDYPAGGDKSWREALHAAIERWPDGDKPPLADVADRPSIASVTQDWSDMPPIRPLDWHAHLGGQEWRVDRAGVYLRGISHGLEPLRTDGAPLTCGRIIELYGAEIAAAARKHAVPPELLIMIIATEWSALRHDDFTGPKTFVWKGDTVVHATGDSSVDGSATGDYCAGPMALAADRARGLNRAKNLGYDSEQAFPFFKSKPRSAPSDLALYRAEIALDVGAALISEQMAITGTDPILVAATYSHGSLAATSTSVWRLMAVGDYIDRAACWFGDACELLIAQGR